ELGLRHGRAVPPSRLTFESDRLVIVKDGLEITSSFAFEARIEPRAAGPLGTADLRLREVTVALAGHEGVPPVIDDGRVRWSGLPLVLAAPVEVDHTTIDLPVRLPHL